MQEAQFQRKDNGTGISTGSRCLWMAVVVTVALAAGRWVGKFGLLHRAKRHILEQQQKSMFSKPPDFVLYHLKNLEEISNSCDWKYLALRHQGSSEIPSRFCRKELCKLSVCRKFEPFPHRTFA